MERLWIPLSVVSAVHACTGIRYCCRKSCHTLGLAKSLNLYQNVLYSGVPVHAH